MADYIDRGTARLMATMALKVGREDPNITADMVRDCVDFWPAADVEEVVRCKDCRFLSIKDFVYGYCEFGGGMGGIVMPDSYCSKGQRKEKE